MNSKNVIVQTNQIPKTTWTCPHCNSEIGEKSLYYDGTNWSHRACKGVITLPESKKSSDKIITENFHEDIDQGLQDVYYEFDLFCKKEGIIYRVVNDEASIQGYLTKGKKGYPELKNYMDKIAKDHNIHMKVDDNRKDGILYTFTLDSLSEMGSWQVLPIKGRKSEDYSPFVNKSDAKKVRQGKTIYQKKPKGFSETLDNALEESEEYAPKEKDLVDRNKQIIINKLMKQLMQQDTWMTALEAKKMAIEMYSKGIRDLFEDQYKHPNKRHTLKQSAYRSSFGPSKSFGGISTADLGRVRQEMIMPKLDMSGNPGVVSGPRTTIAGGKKDDYKTRPYTKRKDATDLPKVVKKKNFIDELGLAVERATKGTSLGRCRDKKIRQVDPKQVVPDPNHESDDPAENLPFEAQQHWGTFAGSWSQAIKGASHSSMNQRTDFGETEEQAQGTDEAGTQDEAIKLSKHPNEAEHGYIYQVIAPDGTKMAYTNKSSAIDFLSEHPGSTADYMQGDMTQVSENDPMDELAGEQNMRPLGEFGPVIRTAPKGNTVSNVRVQHPPDRSFDANSPRISIQSSPT